MAEGLDVTGGAGGSAARIEDMRTYAQIADRIGDHLDEAARQLGSLTVSPAVAVTTPLSPVTAARAQGQAVLATQQLARSLLRVRAQAQVLRTTAQAIAAADAVDTFGQELRTSGSGFLALWANLNLTVWGTPGTYLGHLGTEAVSAARTGLDDGWRAFAEAMRNAPSEAGRQTGSDIGRLWSDLLLDRPEVTNAVVDGTRTVASLLDRRLLSYPELVQSIIRSGERVGWFADAQGVTVRQADLANLHPDALEDTVLPTGLADLMRNQAAIYTMAGADPDGSRLRVIEVPGATGSSWIVHVPGTQEWNPQAGRNPSDLTTNLHLTGHQDAALLDAIDHALAQVGVGDDPVMVVGHSQGGIAAVTFGAQAQSRGYNVTHAVAAGSPLASIEVPDQVQVLAIEHHNDLVPRLDGRHNPDRHNVTTVRADVGGSDDRSSLMEPHASELYRETAGLLEGSEQPSIQHFLHSSAAFFDSAGLEERAAVDSGNITDFDIQRGQP